MGVLRMRELKMFQVTQPFAHLMAAKQKLSSVDFTALLRACSVISFRYNAIGSLSANEQERAYRNAAKWVSANEVAPLNEIIRSLSAIYVAGNDFHHSFSTKSLKSSTRNVTISKYVLSRIEKQVNGDDIDFNSKNVTLERVSPRNVTDEWNEFSEMEHEENLYRLGNYVLLGNRKTKRQAIRFLRQNPKSTKRANSE